MSDLVRARPLTPDAYAPYGAVIAARGIYRKLYELQYSVGTSA